MYIQILTSRLVLRSSCVVAQARASGLPDAMITPDALQAAGSCLANMDPDTMKRMVELAGAAGPEGFGQAGPPNMSSDHMRQAMDMMRVSSCLPHLSGPLVLGKARRCYYSRNLHSVMDAKMCLPVTICTLLHHCSCCPAHNLIPMDTAIPWCQFKAICSGVHAYAGRPEHDVIRNGDDVQDAP